MKIKYFLICFLLLVNKFSYSLEINNNNSDNLGLFIQKYMDENKELFCNIDSVNMTCEQDICKVQLNQNGYPNLLFTVSENYNISVKENIIILTSYYPNGSFIQEDYFLFKKILKRNKRGDYFKPSIDGSWLANERSILLKIARNNIKNNENKNAINEKSKNLTENIKNEENKNVTEKNDEKSSKNTYFFKPSIDGSWLANERSILLKIARKKINNDSN